MAQQIPPPVAQRSVLLSHILMHIPGIMIHFPRAVSLWNLRNHRKEVRKIKTKSTVLPLVMSRNSGVISFTADPNMGFVLWEFSISLGFLLSPSNSWNYLTSTSNYSLSWDRETLDLSFLWDLCFSLCIPTAQENSQSIVGMRVLEIRDSSMDICQKLQQE